MWWIALVVVAVIILIVIIVAITSAVRNDRGDYGDGGGTQVGGGERIPFFAPTNERAGMRGEKLVNYHLRPLLEKMSIY